MVLVKRANPEGTQTTMSWRGRLLFICLIAIAVVSVVLTNNWLTERFTETTRNRVEVRQALYSGNLISELQQNSVVPLLLSRDPNLVNALNSDDYSQTSQRIISYQEEIGSEAMMLLDETGRVVAATDRNILGTAYRNEAFFVDALRSDDTVFTTARTEAGAFVFTYSRKIETNGALEGVVVVQPDLHKFESTWAQFTDAVYVTNSEGTIILTTEPLWRGLEPPEAMIMLSPDAAINRAMSRTSSWRGVPVDAFMSGDNVLRMETKVPFLGWRMTSFTPFTSIRERVNGVLALEVMGFAVLMAIGFYLAGRRARARTAFFQMETEELRQLNDALQREIAERQRAERNLEVAEQTLAQSSKLAAMGEMSASVSHELNQPLAAMKTYLAGAKLLLERKRPEEALASFQRVDDLIERMGSITRQLKSYARKGGEAFEPVDLRVSFSTALEMMEPQLKSREVSIQRKIPREPVLIMADRIRLEQVIINLLRNALDATKGVADPTIEIVISGGETAMLTVRDNGHGIKDLDNLFEPFYTTKSPGDGVGLGLAISSGIITDLGGRLTARNARTGGAVFEVAIPVYQPEAEAAE